MNSQKGFAPIILLVVIFVVTGILGGAYYYSHLKQIPKTPSPQTAKVTLTETTTETMPPSTTPESTESPIETPSVTPRTTTPTPATPFITVDSGWGHFSREFSGPPETNPSSTIDPTTIPFYVSIHNTGTKADRLIGGTSNVCSSITINDMNISGPPGSDIISNIIIPANSTVELKFMGLRMVCNGASGVELGARVPVTLIFEKYGEVTVTIEIREGPE